MAHLLVFFGKHNAMTKQLSLLFLFLCFAVFSFGQQNQDALNKTNRFQNRNQNRNIQPSGIFSFGLEVATPLNQFRSNFDGTPVGLAGQILGRKGFVPIEYGIGFSWLSRGTMDTDISVFQGTDFEGDNIYSSGNLSVNSNIYTGTGIIRLRPLTGTIQPYVELMAGGRSFATATIITVDDSDDELRERQSNDFAFCYGWGAGLRYKLNESIAVEGKFIKMNGTPVNFVDRESIEIDNEGNIDFERISSRTDMWSLQFGISIGL